LATDNGNPRSQFSIVPDNTDDADSTPSTYNVTAPATSRVNTTCVNPVDTDPDGVNNVGVPDPDVRTRAANVSSGNEPHAP
jgi:hypothetical protein